MPLSRPDIGDREIKYVTRVLRTGQLSLGPCVAEFEERFAAFVGTRFAIATNSGTSALHLCVKALGIGPEDEVLTSSFSFVASTNCLLYERAVPTFADIDPATLNLDPAAIQTTITRDCTWERVRGRLINRRSGRVVKAILPVHVFGLPCDMAPILHIARTYNLQVLEDACEALGAEYSGRRVGTFGGAAAFAFYPNKQMTTAEGGMVVTDNPHIAAVCRSLRNQGRDEDSAWLRHVRLGFNYRLSDLHAALGLAQLERLDELCSGRARVAAAYSHGLAGIPQITLPHDSPGMNRSWFVYVIQVGAALADLAAETLRDHLMAHLRARGIACQSYFPPIHRQPYFRQFAQAPQPSLPQTESASARCLALPFFTSMTQDQVDEVCDAVREFLSETTLRLERMPLRLAAADRAAD
ncbi:MAG: DegT/DnrJ/EryC1/StrS family aminotransferase [Candidatus Acidiferrales bacterium]